MRPSGRTTTLAHDLRLGPHRDRSACPAARSGTRPACDGTPGFPPRRELTQPAQAAASASSEQRHAHHPHPSSCTLLCRQLAPRPEITAGNVASRIWRSSRSDQRSTYSMSSFTQSSNSISLRPETCHRQVMPRAHAEPPAVVDLVLIDLAGHRRARSDEAHVADEHVQELRQLVDRVLAQDPAHPRHARIALDLEHRARLLVQRPQLRLAQSRRPSTWCGTSGTGRRLPYWPQRGWTKKIGPVRVELDGQRRRAARPAD